jgi:hypothetical protein
MNEGFINIKVDREERPDVDRMYMAYLQVSRSDRRESIGIMLSCSMGDDKEVH